MQARPNGETSGARLSWDAPRGMAAEVTVALLQLSFQKDIYALNYLSGKKSVIKSW
jgi:hypothetical protein